MQNVRFICGHVGVGQDVRNAEEYSTFVMMRLRQDQALRMPGGVETLPAFWGMLQMQVEGVDREIAQDGSFASMEWRSKPDWVGDI